MRAGSRVVPPVAPLDAQFDAGPTTIRVRAPMTDATSTAAPTRDVVAIGSAIVDVLAQVPEDFLAAHDLAKGAMALVDLARSDALYDAMPSGLEGDQG